MTNYSQSLHRASWRGVPFGMELGSATVGRRKVQHEYPYRDTPWLEDQGRAARSFQIGGFLVGDSALYGGGDVQSQRKRMEAAAESKGPGILVHPSRGRITVDLFSLVITERWDEGNFYELQFTFVQGGTQIFPAVLAALGDLVGRAAGLADAAGIGGFVSAVTGPLQSGIDAASSLAQTAGEWVDKVQSLARDATSLYGTVSQLGGADFGRYFNGRNSGFLAGLTSPYSGAASVADLISAGAQQRASVAASGVALQAAIGGLGVATAPADVAGAAQKMVANLQASASDPADGVRLLTSLAAFRPGGAAAASDVGVATNTLFRRAAAAAVARVGATYAPASADDAHAVRTAILVPIEREIGVAGDAGDDNAFGSLRGLRKAVVDDLGQRGGSLARLVEVTIPSPLPAIVVAQRRYGDAARGDELVTQADPVHPWFMPTAMTALAQ